MECWLPCCLWVVGEGPAVAKVAEVLRVEVVVGCWGEVEAGASYPWVAAINLITRQGKETLSFLEHRVSKYDSIAYFNIPKYRCQSGVL